MITAKCRFFGQNVTIMSWEKLGVAVRDRRSDLGLTQVEVAEHGGLSVETLRLVERNRAGRLSPRLRRALERVLQWQSGSVDSILAGDEPTPSAPTPQPSGGDRFASARQVLSLRTTFAEHRDAVGPEAHEALLAEINRSAREAEESIITVMPWLDDAERGAAIELLVQLREPL